MRSNRAEGTISYKNNLTKPVRVIYLLVKIWYYNKLKFYPHYMGLFDKILGKETSSDKVDPYAIETADKKYEDLKNNPDKAAQYLKDFPGQKEWLKNYEENLKTQKAQQEITKTTNPAAEAVRQTIPAAKGMNEYTQLENNIAALQAEQEKLMKEIKELRAENDQYKKENAALKAKLEAKGISVGTPVSSLKTPKNEENTAQSQDIPTPKSPESSSPNFLQEMLKKANTLSARKFAKEYPNSTILDLNNADEVVYGNASPTFQPSTSGKYVVVQDTTSDAPTYYISYRKGTNLSSSDRAVTEVFTFDTPPNPQKVYSNWTITKPARFSYTNGQWSIVEKGEINLGN